MGIMNYISLNKKEKIPLYVQIYDSILAAIERGELRDQDPLPYEEDIARFYHINRRVVRQAYEQLQEEGLIQRIRRKGTFVSSRPTVIYEVQDLLDMKSLFTHEKFDYAQHVLLVEDLPQSHSMFPSEFKPFSTTCLRVSLLILLNKHPFAIQEIFYPYSIDSFQLRPLLKQTNLIKALLTDRKLEYTSTSYRFKALSLSEIYAKSLALQDNETLNYHQITYLDLNQTPLMISTFTLSGKSNFHHVFVKELKS